MSNLDKLEEPASLIELRDQTAALLPQVDLAELVTAGDWVYCFVPWLHVGFSDRAGKFDWGFQLRFNLMSAPNISPAGIIYACDGECLYALKPASHAVLEKSPWPMWRANPQHTGRVQK